jgi:diaminopimelate decarboxylase
MPAFIPHAGQLYCEAIPLAHLARDYGTPLYVYSAGALRANYRRLAAAFAPLRPLICYAVKANFNLALLKLLRVEGAGFDIVSGGELYRALRAGADPARIVFAGVGKTDAELSAGLDAGLGWFNVESADELARLNALAAARRCTATVALRLNPSVEPDTHHHVAHARWLGVHLGEDAAELLAAQHQVVGPAQVGTQAGDLLDGALHRQARGQREHQHVAGRDIGTQQDGAIDAG